MYPEFAYSRGMQLVLMGVSFVDAFIVFYCIASLIMQMYGERATTKQKCFFALITGPICECGWACLIYLLKGMQSFTEAQYLFSATTNPFFALLYYYVGVKVLGLSKVRSIKLMGYVYIYYIAIKNASRLLGCFLFAEMTDRYNYLLDIFNRLASLVVFLCIFSVTLYFLRRYKHVIKLRDNLFVNPKREIVVFFLRTTVIYLFTVGVLVLLPESVVANVLLVIVFGQALALTIFNDVCKARKNEMENNAVHIGILTEGISAVCMGKSVDLSQKINENPSLVSILMSKHKRAEEMGIRMWIKLNSGVRNLYINNIDACIIIDSLLDTALEKAAVSEQKLVTFSVESKTGNRKLIIVSNSVVNCVDVVRSGWRGLLSGKRTDIAHPDFLLKRIENHGNCIFHLSCHADEMSAYLEIKKQRGSIFMPRRQNERR